MKYEPFSVDQCLQVFHTAFPIFLQCKDGSKIWPIFVLKRQLVDFVWYVWERHYGWIQMSSKSWTADG